MFQARHEKRQDRSSYSYMITPQPSGLDKGWCLHLIKNGEEVKTSAFMLPPGNHLNIMKWWNGLTEDDRTYWMKWAESMNPTVAYQACFTAETYENAVREAEAWIASQQEQS